MMRDASFTETGQGIWIDGVEVAFFKIDCGDLSVELSNHGAAVLSLFTPDKNGFKDDILLGPARYDPELGSGGKASFGVVVGRFANRIAGARFKLGDKEHVLAANDGCNHLHGGIRGFGKRMWQSERCSVAGSPAIRFFRTSPAGEEGYPGSLSAAVTYILDETSLKIEYEAKADLPTHVNLTNHAYFNLSGQHHGDILSHRARFNASRYLETDTMHIPLAGNSRSVEGTAMDFRSWHAIGERIALTGNGYDHCFIADGNGIEIASIIDPRFGRTLNVSSDFPAFQFYTGNYLLGIEGKGGVTYKPHDGFCIETQFYPDSPNRPDFPSTVIQPGQVWKKWAKFTLGIERN